MQLEANPVCLALPCLHLLRLLFRKYWLIHRMCSILILILARRNTDLLVPIAKVLLYASIFLSCGPEELVIINWMT